MSQKNVQNFTDIKDNSLVILTQYKKAMDHSYIISETDPRGIITNANELFCKISGYTKKELIGKPHSIVRHPDMPSAVFKNLWQTIQAKQIWHGIVQNKHKMGGSYFVDATVFPLLDYKENITGYVAIRDDITNLIKAQKEAQAAERAKSAFLATMSHELRTPLNAVIGFSQILMKKTDMPQESMKNYIEKIYTSGKHLLELVNNILDFSKIEDGKMEIHPAKIDLESFMTNTRTLVETAANKKNISITQENFTGKTLVADEQLIRQVLLNLLSNSIKFTPQGKKITLTCKENEAEVIISVCDEGPGLSSEQLEKLFKPFSQIKEHQNEAIKGTGLGLAISQKIMDLHHGFIKVQSELGKGSCFDMHFIKYTKENL
ncbi:MAG: PAS domain-containing sensor histidine kinase [Sulfurospirillum sp.]|nr:PAS domain-containing sensor histidine kinase [Sulfurospirillum sp.]